MDPERIDHQPVPLRLTLELRPEGAGIAGSLCDELGGQHPFTGWLGLLTLLEAVRLRSQVRRGRQTGTGASPHRRQGEYGAQSQGERR